MRLSSRSSFARLSTATLRAGGFALAAVISLVAGCNSAGPDHTAAPTYTGTGVTPFGAGAPVAVRVTDERQKKLGTREDGREVIAQGDKGKVFLAETPAKTLETNLKSALTKAGFKIDQNAPVVVDAKLRQLDVNAEEFTHWGLPSERASTLDAIGAILPGPIRPTSAKTVLDVVIRKHDQRLGYAYYVEKNATNKERDRAVVDQTVSQSLSAAIDEVVKTAAPDITVAAKLPVSDGEIAALSTKLNQQLAEIASIRDGLSREQSQLSSDRADLDATRQALENDRQNWNNEKAQIAGRNKQVTDQALALEQEQARVNELKKTLTAKEAELDKMIKANSRTAADEARLTKLIKDAAKVAEQQAELDRLIKANARTAEQEAQLKKLISDAGNLSAKEAELDRLIKANAAAASANAQETARLAQLAKNAARVAEQQAELDRLIKANAKSAEQEAALRQLQAETAAQQADLAKSREAVAVEQQRVTRAFEQINREKADLERRQREFETLKANLEARAKELSEKERSTDEVRSGLVQQQTQLSQKEDALKEWDRQLKAKASEPSKPPTPLVVNIKPSIAVIEPQPNDCEVATPRVVVRGLVVDDQAVAKVKFTVNGKEVKGREAQPMFVDGARGIRPERGTADTPRGVAAGRDAAVFERYEFAADLNPGANVIVVEAWDDAGQPAREELRITYRKGEGKVYVVAIGINQYQNVPKLKYAVADAELFAKTLQEKLDIPVENIELLLDENATLQKIKHVLGVTLKARVTPQDMAVIFFSGHGAPEEDAQSPDQDGLEKYLLPVDTNMTSFFSTAIPMKDMTDVFRRLRCQRIVFVADTCYSGAVAPGAIAPGAAARSFTPEGKSYRAIRVERVMNRLGGTGRIIMTASKGSEISQEKDDLGHGVFTYYIAQGLGGKADKNRDRMVTVTEVYDYVSVEVPKATANNQNPLMSKDEAVGEIVLSILK